MINILGVVNDRSFGIWGKNTLKALHSLQSDYTFFPLHPVHVTNDDESYFQSIRHGIDKAQMFDPDSSTLTIWHQWDLARQVGRGKRCAWTLFELNKLSDLERHHLNYQDLVILPSEWHVKVAADQGIKSELRVCPLGVDTSIFYPIKTRMSAGFSFGDGSMVPVNVKSKDTVFISVGKWEKRKGHDLLPGLFAKAFTTKDNVRLFCHHYNPFLNVEETKAWHKLYKESLLGYKIQIVSERLDKDDSGQEVVIPYWYSNQALMESYNSADAALCISRTEGWDLPALESLACGLQVIGTDYSGHTGFLNEKNCKLVPVKNLETANDGKWFNGSASWASLDKDAEECIIEHMRDVHRRKQNGEDVINHEGVKTEIGRAHV